MTTLRQAITSLVEGAKANPQDHVPTVSVADLEKALADPNQIQAVEYTPVAVGQVWEDNDPRSAGRTLRVDAIDPETDKVTVTTLTVARNVSPDQIGRTSKIAGRRFTPTSTGYRLISDK